MKKIHLSPALVVALAVVLVFTAACNRPDQQQTLDTPQPMNVPQQPGVGVTAVSQEVNATPTLPIAVGTSVNLGATVEAGSPAAPATPPAVVSTLAAIAPTALPTPAPQQPAAPAPQQPSTATTGGNQSYVVKPGDTLFSIGRLYNVNPYSIAAANTIPYPYIIYPGQQLIIPTGGTTPPSGATPIPPQPGGCRYYHQVRLGENLYRISLAYGVPMATIAAANGIVNYNLIYAGQTLCIP